MKLQIKLLLAMLASVCAVAFRQPDVLALGNATENSTGFRAFQATAAAIIRGKRVQVDVNGLISVAAAVDGAVGVTIEDIPASGWGTVKLFNAAGTFIIWANAALARGAKLFPTAAGGIDDAGTTALPLVALEAATAQGDLIECGPLLLGA